MTEHRVRAVAFREGDWWVAQCLEYDIAVQARRMEDLPGELQKVLTVQILASIEAGIEPLLGLPRAPRRFWNMYERSSASMPVQGDNPSLGLPAGVDAAPPQIETRIAA